MIQPSHPPQPSREPFEKAYKVGPVLGKGGFGIVYAGVRNRDGLQVAIKHIAKAKIKDWGQVRIYWPLLCKLADLEGQAVNHSDLDNCRLLLSNEDYIQYYSYNVARRKLQLQNHRSLSDRP